MATSGGTERLDDLLRDVLAAVSVPVVAAGGVGSAERVGGWPAPVRVLRTSLDAAVRVGNRSTAPPSRPADAALEMAGYAGLSVEDVHEVKPAAEVVRELTALLA